MQRRLRSLLKVDRQAAEIASAAALLAFPATFQLPPLKRRPVKRRVFSFLFFLSFCIRAPCRLAIRSADTKVFGVSARLHFRGTAAPIDQSAQTCPGPSPPMHHGAACWSQKSLTTTNISAATACLPLISCREIFLEYPSPFEEGEERKPHPSPPQSPGNYSQTHCSFFALPPLLYFQCWLALCCSSRSALSRSYSISTDPPHSTTTTHTEYTVLTILTFQNVPLRFIGKLKGRRHCSWQRKDKATQHDTVAPIISPTEKLVIKTLIFQLIDSSKWQPFFSWLDRIH